MKLAAKQKVIELRKSGKTISEIQKIVPVSKSSISLWMQDIKLSKEEQNRIDSKITLGQMKSRGVLHQKALLRQIEIEKYADSVFNNLKINTQAAIIFCSCLYECEGGKGKSDPMNFTNSNPYMVKVFLKLLRKSFELDEKKFRVCVHLHSYHNKEIQLKFWSKVTKIPLTQFMKPYMKNSSGMYKSEGYAGCVSIRYHDVSLKRKMLSIFKKLDQYL